MTGRLLVTLAPADAHAHAVAVAAGARLAGPQLPQLRLVTVRPRAGASAHALALRLRRDPRVARVDVEHRAVPRALPDDPALTAPIQLTGLPPGTPEEWWAAAADLTGAWDQVRGAGALVAVIDQGVDATHPELSGQIAGSISEGGGPATEDDVGHGTHVASLACAATDNGLGIAGAGDGCRLLVARSDFSDASIAASIVWAADHGARAIAMSFGTDPGAAAPAPVVDALRYAAAKGAVPVAAAADAPLEDQGYPADVVQPDGSGADTTSNLGLSVTASTFAGALASFAGRGSEISLAAPGTTVDDGRQAGLLGAFPQNVTALETGNLDGAEGRPCGCRTTFAGDSRWAYLQGTSMAVPLVAGAAALVRTANPALSSADVVALLKRTAARPAGAGWTPDLGWGVLDAGAAVRAARAIDRTPPSSRLTVAAASPRARSRLLRWTGGDAGPPGIAVSGVARWEIWRSRDGARARRIARLPAAVHALRVRLVRGVRYRFFSIAVDRAGNREAPPARADASLRVR
ncbi:MAG TPA: S8 family serine peptidase [Solirubrobacteraceae bacterium]|nr:S8 family serine peptidase [Solirubrobacteraceae bacterium]